jgi:hypothetical protein
MRRILFPMLLGLSAAVGCHGDAAPQPTGIVLEVQSEYAVPAELNGLHVTVTGLTAGGLTKTALDQTFDLGPGAGRYTLPARMALVPIGEGDGRVHVDVKGLLNAATVVERSATLTFFSEHWVLLTLTLGKACSHMSCPAEQTCAPEDGVCHAEAVNASTLPMYVKNSTPMMVGAGGAGGSSAGGQGGGTAGTGAAGAGGSGGATGPCNALQNVAPAVIPVWVEGAQPTPAGGTLVDGTYYLTAVSIYTGPGGVSGPTAMMRKMVLVISNAASGTATFQFIDNENVAGGGTDRRATWTVTPNGTKLVVVGRCPNADGTGTTDYAASGNTFTLYHQTDLALFTRQ